MKQNSKSLLVLLALGLLLSCARIPQQLVSEKPVAPVVDLASEKIRDSIVLIESENISGTGFFIAPDKIATNTHVVAHAGPVSVKSPDKEKSWTIEGVIGFDAKNSLVILKLTDEGTPLSLGNSDAAQTGESISILGYPDGEFKITEGNIQSIRKNKKWLRVNTTTSKETNGSPVLDNSGQVIGVIVPYGNYAVSSNVLEASLAEPMPIEPLSEWQKREHVRAAAYYGLGKEKFGVKDYAGAIVDFDKAIELDPAYVRAYFERGRAQSYLGDYDSAIAACTQVLEMDPDEAGAYYTRGNVKAHLGDYTAAIVDLDKAIELDAQYAYAYSDRGGIKLILGVSEEAKGNTEKAQSLYEMAIADCHKAVEIDSEYAYAYNFLGGAKASLGDFEGAILDFNRAIQIDAEDATIYNNRGSAKIKFGESENARGNTKKARHLYEAAVEDYTQAIKINPDGVDTYKNRGAAKLAFGELESVRGNPGKTEALYEGAIEDFTQVIKVNPEDDSAYNDRGLTKFRLGKSEAAHGNTKEAQRLYEGAIEDYTQSIKIAPDDLTHNNRGLARTAFGELESTRGNAENTEALYEAAIADYVQAIKINPKYAKAYKNRATVKCKLGDIESARGDAEKAQTLYREGIIDYGRYIQIISPDDIDAKITDLESQHARNSTVRVMGWSGNLTSGSGFFVDKNKIVTNFHVIAELGPVFAMITDKEEVWAVEGVTAYDAKNDLVILNIAGEGVPLPLDNSDAVKMGDAVTVVGYPGGEYKTVSKGMMHSIRNSDKWFKVKVEIAPGNSGSPVINSGGQVIGIVSSMEDPSKVTELYGYAIPSNVLRTLLTRSMPSEPLAHWYKRDRIRAYAKYALDQHEEAIADFDSIIQLNPEDADAYMDRA